MSLLLNPSELRDLTGRKQPALQIRWLAANQWRFEVGGDGLPKVDREYYRARMGLNEVKTARKRVRTEGLARGTA